MLVSTLIFILIGFMLIVLFSMIPVVWRIRTDYFGMGDQEGNNYRRYVRDFAETMAEPLSREAPGEPEEMAEAPRIQPQADPAL